MSGFSGGSEPTPTPVTIQRRSVLVGLGFVPLLRLLPASTIRAAFGQPIDPSAMRFFDEHQAAVVTEATARLIPGPLDDPAEAGHPGAREAGVVGYIDLFLSAFDTDPPRIFATGPWSDRHGGEDEMDAFIPLTAWQQDLWRGRIADLQEQYREGIAALDAAAGGDFTSASPEEMDRILIEMGSTGFRRVLFEHAIEGTYAAPEYGGNRELAGWTEIHYEGDIAPRGYPPDEVAAEVPDPVGDDVEIPFPPDMASTGTEDPLGGAALGAEPASVSLSELGFDGPGVDSGEWFGAAEPGIAKSLQRRPRQA